MNASGSTDEKVSAKPVGMGDYKVRQGECMNGIALKHGFFWKTLWNHQNNGELRKTRLDHNALLPGDRVFIPKKEKKTESVQTQQTHRFRRKGVPSQLKIRLLEDGSPESYSNQPYELLVEGTRVVGAVDSEGYVAIPIYPGAHSAKLIVGDGDERESFDLSLSSIDPIDVPSGAQQRLINLGLFDGEPSASWSEEAVEALKEFQALYLLQDNDGAPTGEYDEQTRQELFNVYGC